MDQEAVKLAESQIGVGNIDAIKAQKQELLHLEINKAKADYDKIKVNFN